MADFQSKIDEFVKSIDDLSKNNSVPKWIRPFLQASKKFANELGSQLVVKETVLNTLMEDRDSLMAKTENLEDELDDLQQYSRRTCLLIHGVKEEKEENVETVVNNVIKDEVKVKLDVKDVARTHRLGKKRSDDKPRPIIVRFLSYRQWAKVFSSKKNLKGKKTFISENLTKKRYSLLQTCIEKFGNKNVWSYDGRIYALIDTKKECFTTEKDLSDFLENHTDS